MKLSPWLACVWLSLAASAALADSVSTNDGNVWEGTVKHNGDGWDVITPDGRVVHVLSGDVKQIQISPKVSADADLSHLISLRHSVENLTDARQGVERFQRFVEQYKDTPAAAEAAKDLAEWKQRVDQGMVKFGSRWVTPEVRLKLQEKAFEETDHARRLVKAGRLKDAGSLLEDALIDDPGNVSALYLLGIIDYGVDQLAAARQYFESVTKTMPDCAPALNNTAVVLWRQGQMQAAVAVYDEAMRAAPETQEILNNVAEALAALPADIKVGAIAQVLQQHFTVQDAAVQERMGQRGWYRWGSNWVNKDELARLKEQEQTDDHKADDLNRQIDDTQARIDKIDSDVDENTRVMRRLDAQSYVRDALGRWVHVQLPQSYYDLDDDNQHLKAQRADLSAKLELLKTAAKDLQQHPPGSRFTGVQQLIGAEGTPLIPPGPATLPAK